MINVTYSIISDIEQNAKGLSSKFALTAYRMLYDAANALLECNTREAAEKTPTIMKNIFSRNSKLVANSLLAAILLAYTPVAHAARAKKKQDSAPPVVEVTPSPYTFEIGLDYNSAINDIFEDIGSINTVGGNFTVVYKKDEHGSYTLRLGFGTGSGKTDDDFEEWNEEWDVTHVSLMPGYRYTAPLGEKTDYFIGANIGLMHQSVKFTISGDIGSDSVSGNSTGLGYSAEIGILHKWSEKMSLLLAYQLSGSTNETELGDADIKTKQQMYHTIRVGVNVKF